MDCRKLHFGKIRIEIMTTCIHALLQVFASCFPGIGRCTSDSASKHFDISMIATYVHVEGIKLF